MHLRQFRVRTLMFVIWLLALLFVGALDVLKEQRSRNRVEVINEKTSADGSRSFTLIYTRRTYYLGPVPIGPCPIAVLSGLAILTSIMVWGLCQRAENRRQ